MKNRIGLLSALASLALFAMPASANECDRECLQSQLDRYLTALTQRDASKLSLASGIKFTENGKAGALGKDGLWQKASALGDYRYRLADPVTQQAMFIGTLDESGSPAIATIRLGLQDGKIAEVEHVVARKGSHALFSPERFTNPHPSLLTKVSKPMSRERLVEIADSYFEGIEQHNSKVILADDACQRFENGVQTTNQPGRTSKNCAHSADLLTYIKSVDDRRYPIVDREHGVVVSTILFDIPPSKPSEADATIASDPRVAARLRQPRTLLLTEWFKIDHDKIQYIEAIMHNLPHGSKSGWEH